MAKSRKSTQTRKAATTNSEWLAWALEGIEHAIAATRQRLEDLEAQARQLRSGRAVAAPAASMAPVAESAPAKAKKRASKGTAQRKLSADARKRIAEAQKRRWAKYRAAKTKS